MTGALLTLAFCLFIYDGWHNLFRDSDAGWHIRTGERILETRTLPRTDPYSFSRPGAAWMDWEWGADVITGAVHGWMDLPGEVVLFALAIAACTWLWFHLTWQAGGDFLLAGAFAVPMLATVKLHWLARPHVFGWLLLLGWMLWMERGGTRLSGRLAAVCAAFGIVWANVHGSFLLGLLVVAIYAGCAVVKPLIWTVDRADAVDRTKWYSFAGLCFAAGTVLNPYGIALHAHVVEYLSDEDLLSRVAEFQSFNFHSQGAHWIQMTIGLCALGAVAALANRRPEHLLVSLLFLSMSLHSARALPILALCSLPLANAGITMALRSARGLSVALRKRLNAASDYSARLRARDRRFSGLVWIPIVVTVLVVAAQSPSVNEATDFPSDEFPSAAMRRVEALPIDARILATDRFGGYLIYRFSGRRKVFFDGRSDFYGPDFLRDYLRLSEARPGWQEIAARFHFTHALLPADSPLSTALQTAGWHLMHKDGIAALLSAPQRQ